VVVVLDGFRPDYVSRENTPNIFAIAQEGVVCTNHHAAFPSVTRVNSATIATGCYPGRHGLLGNTIYFPEIDPAKGLSAANAKNLMDIEKTTGGHLLTIPSLGERLQAAGKKIFVASSGSGGSATLVNHKYLGGGVANVDVIEPASLRGLVTSKIGPVPAEAAPNIAQNRWAVDAYLKVALPEIAPDLSIIWLSDPDHTAHGAGIGAPKTMDSIKTVDAEVGRIAKALRDRDTDLFIMSDHGFSTYTGGSSLTETLVSANLKESKDSEDVVIVGGAIYVRKDGYTRPDEGPQPHPAEAVQDNVQPGPGDLIDIDRKPLPGEVVVKVVDKQSHIIDIVRALQSDPKMGAIFTRAAAPGSPFGIAPGTLSLELIHVDHDRAPDNLVSEAWTDAKNEFGYPGATADSGTAGHGSSSPYDIHATLIATGPHIRNGAVSDLPTGQIDLAPTLCHLLGITPAEGMDGRVLTELFPNSTDAPKAVQTTQRTSTPGGAYKLEATITTVGATQYLDQAKAIR
jgi:arylsulfatase A-like enzyme